MREGEELLHPKGVIDDRTLDVYKDYSKGVGSFEGTSGAGPSIVGFSTLA